MAKIFCENTNQAMKKWVLGGTGATLPLRTPVFAPNFLFRSCYAQLRVRNFHSEVLRTRFFSPYWGDAVPFKSRVVLLTKISHNAYLYCYVFAYLDEGILKKTNLVSVLILFFIHDMFTSSSSAIFLFSPFPSVFIFSLSFLTISPSMSCSSFLGRRKFNLTPLCFSSFLSSFIFILLISASGQGGQGRRRKEENKKEERRARERKKKQERREEIRVNTSLFQILS
jgi:hypothetical protein